MKEEPSFNLQAIKAELESLPPTQQIRYIASFELPECKEDLIECVAFLKDGAEGHLSKFRNVTDAYHRKYDKAYAVAQRKKISNDELNKLKLSNEPTALRVLILSLLAILVILMLGSVLGSVISIGGNSALLLFGHKTENQTAGINKIDNDFECNDTFDEVLVATSKESPETEVVMETDEFANITDEETSEDEMEDLKFSGMIGNREAVMEIAFSNTDGPTWGTYSYKNGAKDLVLQGTIKITDADKYSVHYTATLYERDPKTGNQCGLFELDGLTIKGGGSKELFGKYYSENGEELSVMLRNNEKHDNKHKIFRRLVFNRQF